MCIIGLKKTTPIAENDYQILELDELYWFIEKKAKTETRENVYVMTMISRKPRQIVGFEIQSDKSAIHIQNIVDHAPWAQHYCTDGYFGYFDVVFPGKHIRNVRDKRDTHNIESINADLRHYIPILARCSRCFSRSLETLRAVVKVFVCAYNKFGVAKMKFRQNRDPKSRELPFSVLDFL
jgi:Transposase and inactivated derivatives, IS1 family